MKKIILSVLSLVLITLLFSSCEKKYDDFMTGEAKTGGLLLPQGSFPYKLGGTIDFSIGIDVPKGPGIVSVEVWKSYTGIDKVLDQTIAVNSENETAIVSKTLNYNYASLTAGLGMPVDESVLNIGDAWTLSYVAIMDDGRRVDSGLQTTIGVANFFAGTYDNTVIYYHPSRGTYPNNGATYTDEKTLVATSANTCKTTFGVWADECWITINADNSITFVVSDTWPYDVLSINPEDATQVSSYDPATGTIQLYYAYMGGGGYRIFDEVFTVPVK